MGLVLLEILPAPQLLPASAIRTDQGDDTSPLQGLGVAYVFGASTALVASPCATPVLASLLSSERLAYALLGDCFFFALFQGGLLEAHAAAPSASPPAAPRAH